MPAPFLISGVLAVALAWPAGAALDAARQSPDALITQAYDAAFNLAHDRAIALAREAVAAAPEDSRAHRTLASMLWQKMLFLRGTVTVDHFMSGMSDTAKHLSDPPPALAEEFHAALDRAQALADARMAREPDSLDARYDVGAAYGLQASYTASIDGSLGAAFRTAKRAFDAQEAVLEQDPRHPQASVVVGTYRYLVSRLGLPTRWLAYIAGFGGGTERGIAMLEQALEAGGATMEAGTALLLIYSREGRHEDAYRLAQRLAAHYPDNRLLVLEAGGAAARAGLAADAVRILSSGLARLDGDPRPKVPGERAIWLYQLGQARLQMGRPEEAARALEAALEHGPHGWMRGRVLVALGKLDDIAGRRGDAQAHYREARRICEALDDTICEREVKRLQERPFRAGGGIE